MYLRVYVFHLEWVHDQKKKLNNVHHRGVNVLRCVDDKEGKTPFEPNILDDESND